MCEALEEDILQNKGIVEEYSQWLGSFLRDSDVAQENEEWRKTLEKLGKAKSRRKTKKAKKRGKSGSKQWSSDHWIQFKEIMLSASEQGEAEILFDAIESLSNKVDRLEKAKDSLLELERSRLGGDITYIAYFCDGIPEKVVLRHRKDQEFEKKFQYMADFSIVKDA
jgi:hypothetical protein